MKVGLGCQGVYPSCGVDAGSSLDLDAFPLRLNKFEAKSTPGNGTNLDQLI